MVFVLEILAALLGRISLSSQARLCRVIAFLAYDLLGLRRRVIRGNLDIVFGDSIPESRKAEIGRRSIQSFLQTVFELIGGERIYAQMRMEVLHEERLLAALAEGKGAYGLGIHQGDWEYVLHACSRFGKVNLALKPIGGKKTAAWVRNRRAALKVYEIPRHAEKPAWQLMIECLARGELVGMVVDQRRRKGERVPLFGQEAWTNASLFRLWRQHPAPIVPMSVRRRSVDVHEVLFWEPLQVLDSPEWSEKEFLQQNAIQMNALVEKMILWNPDEYFWMHDRWKDYK